MLKHIDIALITVVGIVCGIFLLAVLIAVLIYVRRLKRNKKNQYTPPQMERDEPAAHDPLLTRHGESLSVLARNGCLILMGEIGNGNIVLQLQKVMSRIICLIDI